jgi:hypothetical protein
MEGHSGREDHTRRDEVMTVDSDYGTCPLQLGLL